MPARPQAAQIWQAIETYLRVAYDGDPPAAVRTRLDQLRSTGEAALSCPALERDDPERPTRYALRLGNKLYPHMKLIIDCSRGPECLFRADTHDAHCRPPEGSREMAMYQELVNRNRQIASAIEEAWTAKGLETFKTYLKRDLERRRSGATT